jgi:hypothetical protein
MQQMQQNQSDGKKHQQSYPNQPKAPRRNLAAAAAARIRKSKQRMTQEANARNQREGKLLKVMTLQERPRRRGRERILGKEMRLRHTRNNKGSSEHATAV